MRAARALLLAGLLAAALVVVAATPAAAQAGERIDAYAAELVVENNGDLRVRETITYDFGTNQKHGIFRFIPVRFPYDNKYDRIYRISDVDVSAAPGTPDDVKVTDENGRKVFRIGDPDRTITGRHVYEIRYRVRGALNGFDEHDELYWNALGNEWPVGVASATATVRGPAPITKVACFAGPQGSTLPCDSAAISPSGEATFTQGTLDAGGALTVVAALPKGAVTAVGPILDERWAIQRAFALTPASVGGALALAVLGFAWVGRRLWKDGRDRRLAGAAGTEEPMPLFEDMPSPVEYRPPEDLRPAQLGVLLDEVADPLDVTATIVDLAVRGYLVIEEIPKSGWFGKRDWNLVRKKVSDDALLPYEKKLHDSLFEDGDAVLLSSLKNKFFDDLKKVQNLLYQDCLKGKWFTRRPDSVRTAALVIGILLLVAGIGVTVLLAIWTHYALLGIPVALTGLFLVATHRRMPARTAKGTAGLARVHGFRRFIETAQVERLQFAEEENIFAKYLPYAIVFGATKKWMKAFEDLGATPGSTGAMGGMGWYSSPHPFSAARFSDDIQSFSTRTAGTIVSTPSSSGSSGFGGGGSSGGGGGGGGGGSW